MRHPWQPALLLAFLALLVGGLPAFAQQEFPEAAALLQFRASFSNGEAVLPSWASAEQDPCTSWAEVQCSSATGNPRVIRLSLAGYMLEGEVEEGAWNLTTLDQLQSLDLSNNLIAGSLTSSVFSALPPSLLELQLGDNLLEGTLPPSLALPPRLSRLGLDGNQLAGTIPQVWALPETITFLGLSNNLLAGALPRSWALPSLLRMQLHNNSLAGRVSEWEAPQQAQVTIFPTTSQGFCGEVPPSPQYIALEGDREVLIFSLPECTLLPPVMDWPILDPGCSQVVELGENDTQAALAYSYGQDWAFFARLNGGLGANDTLDPGSNLCVFPAQLPEGGGFSCPPEPAWPPAMITDTNATDLAARLEEFCPQISPLPDNFAAAVMCCSGERSEALASALEHSFRAGCTSPCVFNPTFEEGAVEGEDGSFPAWFWDEPNGCWVVDNPENPACLPSHSPALQSSRDTLAAAEAQPILLDLLLPRCAARLPGGVAEELQAAQSEPMPAGSALLEALASPCAADALQAAPLGSQARLLQQKFSPGRAAECDLANTLSLNTSSCICNPAIPYLHCHAAMVQDLQALVEEAAKEAADAEDGSRRRNHRRLLSRPDSIPLGEWVGEGRSAEELLGVFSAGGGGGGWEAEETCVAGGVQGVGLEFCFTPQVDLEEPPETRWDLLDEFVVRQSQEPWPACGMPPDLFDSPDPISQTSADAYLSQTLTLPSAACLDLPPPLAQLAADIAAAAGLATDDRGRVCGLAGDTVLLPNLGSLWLSMAAVPQQPPPTTLRLLSELWAQWTFDQAPACVAATKSPVLNSRLGCTLQCRLGPQPEPWDAVLGVGIGSPLFYWSPLPGGVLYATSPEALPDCLAAANPGGECVSPAPAPPPAPPSPAPVGNVPPPPAIVVPTPPTAPPVVLPPPPPTPPVAVPSPPHTPPVVVPTPPTTPPVVVPPPQSPPPPRPPVLPPLDPPSFPPPAPSPPPSSPEYNQSPPQASPPPPSPRPSPQPRPPPPSPSPALPPPPPPKPSPSPSPSRSPSPSPSTAPAPAPGPIPAAPPSPAPEPSPALPPQMPSPSPEEQSPSPAQPSPSPQDPPAPAADPPAAVQPSPSPQGSNPSPAGSAPGPAVE